MSSTVDRSTRSCPPGIILENTFAFSGPHLLTSLPSWKAEEYSRSLTMAPASVPAGHTPYSWHDAGGSSVPPGHTVFSWGSPTSLAAEQSETEESRRLQALLDELADCDARLTALEAKATDSSADNAQVAPAAPAFFPPENQWLRFGNCSATVAPGSQLDLAGKHASNAKASRAAATAKEAAPNPQPEPQPKPAEPKPPLAQPEQPASPQPKPPPAQPEQPASPQPEPEPQPELQPEPKAWVDDGAFVGCMECQLEFWFFRWRHHCRGCGRLLCDNCSTARIGFATVITATGVRQGVPTETYRACENCVGAGSTLT